MNLSEATRLLTLCAAYDSRTIGESDVIAWHDALNDIPFDDAKKVVVDFYRTATDGRIKPGNIYIGVKKIRRDRVEGADVTFIPPAEIEGESEASYARRTIEAKRVHLKKVGDGARTPQGPELTRSFDPNKLMRDIFRDAPRIVNVPSQRR